MVLGLVTNVYLMIFVVTIPINTNAQTIDCDNVSICPSNTFDCDKINNVDCVIQCLTRFSCTDAVFNGGIGNMQINCGVDACNQAQFNGGNGTMVINCGQGACSGTTWNGGGGDMIGNCIGDYSCDEGYKLCPPNKYCNITCDGRSSCAPGSIRAGDGNTMMNIVASGSRALETVNIYCPENYIRGGKTNSCNIYGHNTPSNNDMMSGLKIYALEGFHDVNIICDNGNTGCFENAYDSNTRARLFCTAGWTTSCPLEWNVTDVNDGMECYKDPAHICEDYLLPTPTVFLTTTTAEPTGMTGYPTDSPTPSPTRYDPNKGRPQILYVSKLGCDYGYCMNKNYSDYDSNETDTYFDYCGYNSVCCNNITSSIPNCQEVINTWEASKGEYAYGWYPGDKIVTINNVGQWKEAVIGDDGSEDDTRDLIRVICFEIEPPFICTDPIVKIEFEDIGYSDTYHFDVSYQNETELALAGCSGGSGQKTCDSWYECPVDVQVSDGPWMPYGGGHAFWVTDSQPAGQVWRPECFSPRRAFQVRVSINCSTVDVNPPRCRTLDYTWNCLNAIGGAPVDTVCSDAGYDGNGEIKISNGTYTLNNNIYIQHEYQQVVIEGRGFNDTFLNQIISNDNIAVSCARCNFTMKGLAYHIESSGAASSMSNIIIQVINDGNTTFDDVLFMTDVETLKFIFSDNSNVEFRNCIFRKNVTFNITNGATVLFNQCTFININGNFGQQDSIINIENSVLLIKETVFAENNDLFSIIESGTDSNVIIQNSMFIENRNIDYLWYLFDSNGSMKNTTNDGNECVKDYCISSIDSDLLIDTISIFDDSMLNTIKMLQFGHNDNDTNIFSILYLWDFNPQSISQNIDLLHFSAENGKIVFVPCNPFEDAFRKNIIFDTISLGLIPTHLYNESGAFDMDPLTCNYTSLCYISCVTETLTCFRSDFTAETVTTSLFECSSSSSCQEGRINISSSTTAAILCIDPSSCEKMKVHVTNTDRFTLECVMTGSCSHIEIFVTNTSEANIKCFSKNACNGMRVTSDSNEIGIYIAMWSGDIIINVPSQYLAEYLHCNDNAYLSLNGLTFNSLQTSVEDLFGDTMPCEDVIYKFQSNAVQCEIRYNMFSNNEINQLLTYLEDYMDCYPPIFIDDFVSYQCFGSESPTKLPTMDPTLKPTMDPTPAPSLSPTSTPSRYPTSDISDRSGSAGFGRGSASVWLFCWLKVLVVLYVF